MAHFGTSSDKLAFIMAGVKNAICLLATFLLLAFLWEVIPTGGAPAVRAAKEARANQELIEGEPIVFLAFEPTEYTESRTYLGEFTITGFCSCEKCCGKWSNTDNPTTASGTIATAGRTVGTDFGTISQGTKIYIEGVGYRTAEDKPTDWIIERYNGKIIDVYYDSHDEALECGRHTAKVWEVK